MPRTTFLMSSSALLPRCGPNLQCVVNEIIRAGLSIHAAGDIGNEIGNEIGAYPGNVMTGQAGRQIHKAQAPHPSPVSRWKMSPRVAGTTRFGGQASHAMGDPGADAGDGHAQEAAGRPPLSECRPRIPPAELGGAQPALGGGCLAEDPQLPASVPQLVSKKGITARPLDRA